jgi:hypothetical protein
MARLNPRAADVAALASLAHGHCTWPDCRRKIYDLVDGKWQADCIRAHIEAAEEGGPRWRSAMTDAERRAPDNLIWLCQKHHTAVDDNEKKYTVVLLKQWKLDRETSEPGQRFLDGLPEERLQEIVDQSMDRLVAKLEELDLPGVEVAEMLVRASERLPNAEVAQMLVVASERMPSEDTAGMLYYAGQLLPSEDTAGLLSRASEFLPSEDTASMLLRAAELMPNEDTISLFLRAADDFPDLGDLQRLVDDLRQAAREIEQEVDRASHATIAIERPPHHTDDPWRWFGFGVATAAVLVLAGLIIYAVVSNR